MMRGSLGEKIGEGATADIHAWAPGRVVKLFKPGVPPAARWHEARMTRAAVAAGLPAPQVFNEVTVDGRFGFVLSRFDGPTLLQLVQSRAVTPGQAGAILASLFMSVHKVRPPEEVIALRDWMAAATQAPGGLPVHIVPGLRRLIERLPPHDGLCHCDLHPNNVIMTAAGPRLIDWTWTKRAAAALDLAHGHVILCELIPDGHDDPERPRAVDAAVRSAYAGLAGLTPEALAAAMAPWLPVARGFLLFIRAGDAAQRQRLILSVEATLRAEALM